MGTRTGPPMGTSDTAEERRTADTTVPDRRCGRCQRPFPGDPTLNFQTDWALCPDCAAVLMPPPPASA